MNRLQVERTGDNRHALFTRTGLPRRMEAGERDTDEDLVDRGRVVRPEAEELFRVAAIIRE